MINHRAYRDNPTKWLGTCVQRTDRRLSFRGKFWLSYFGALLMIVVVACTAGCGGGDASDASDASDTGTPRVNTPTVDCTTGTCL